MADEQTERHAIAQRAGLSNDNGLRVKLNTLIELGYLEERRNIDATPNSTLRYGLADAALRFYHRFVSPNISMLVRYPASDLYSNLVAPHLDAYLAFEFERIAAQAYDRRASCSNYGGREHTQIAQVGIRIARQPYPLCLGLGAACEKQQ